MSANETPADIVAEMRKRKEQLEDAIFAAPICYSTEGLKSQAEILDEFIDRLDAALKREPEREIVSRRSIKIPIEMVPTCSMAAMRETLEAVAELFIEIQGLGRSPMSNKAYAVKRKVYAALSIPPRNCERFKTKEEAAIAFANEKKQWIPQQVLWELAPWLDWLFATATKGEAE